MNQTIVAVVHSKPEIWDLMEKTGDGTYTHMARFISAAQAARFCTITRLAADPAHEVLLEIRLPQNEIDLLNSFAKHHRSRTHDTVPQETSCD